LLTPNAAPSHHRRSQGACRRRRQQDRVAAARPKPSSKPFRREALREQAALAVKVPSSILRKEVNAGVHADL
jgi:hypothetical protein